MKSISVKIPSSVDEGWARRTSYEFLLSTSILKMAKFKKQMETFERKHSIKFEEFEEKVKKDEKENFEEWDDYIIWEGLQKGYMQWKKVYEDISDG
ncbi:MAG: hypothetical protein HXS40_10905 [Theionarchaea archaeon]|nr:hypothetical protein [Theionarchaea archaeon]